MTDPRGRRIQRYAPSQVPASAPAELRTWLASEFRAVAAVQTNAEWDSLADAPTDFPPGPHQHDWDDIFGEPGAYPPSPHVHGEADITDLDRLRWRGAWEPGVYERNDLVRDGRWLMAATATTSDEPVVEGDPFWAIDPEPVWTGQNTSAVFGARLLGTQDAEIICAMRVKARQSGPFDLWMVLNGLRIDVATGLALTAGVWREFHFHPIAIPAGATLDLVASGGSYNQAVDYFIGNPKVRGFLGAIYPPTPGELSDDAFGIDAYFILPTVSPDWEVL